MEVVTLWASSPVSSFSEEETDMQEYVVEEIIIEEDGNETPERREIEEAWASTSVNIISPSSTSDTIEIIDLTPDSPTSLVQQAYSSPSYILPHDALTEEEDGILNESFDLMEDLMSMKDVKEVKWKHGPEIGGTLADKAQALLNDLDDYIKQEPFSDWLEEKTELPLFEELGNYVNYQRSPYGLNVPAPAVPHQPRPVVLPTPHVGQIAPTLDEMIPGMTLLNSARVPSPSAQMPPQLSTPPQNLVLPPSPQQVPSPPPPLTPALIREFESVLHRTLTPPHTPPTILDLVNTQEENVKNNNLEEDIDTLINSQIASLYEDKSDTKISEWVPVSTQDSPDASDWGSISTYEEKNQTEDSDSTCPSSSESDQEWSPSQACSGSGRSKRAISSTEERKIRKKEQNKNAATRYRLKKKAEQAEILDEELILVEKNSSLKEKTTELQREIKYLKSLMREICKVKGLIS